MNYLLLILLVFVPTTANAAEVLELDYGDRLISLSNIMRHGVLAQFRMTVINYDQPDFYKLESVNYADCRNETITRLENKASDRFGNFYAYLGLEDKKTYQAIPGTQAADIWEVACGYLQ